MHPEFQQYAEGSRYESVRLRVSSEEKARLSDALKAEGGNSTELLVEGIWRVIGSRRSSLGQPAPLVIRPKQPRDQALNIRLTDTEAVTLSTIATKEGCSLSDLVGEGIWHVLVNRQQNEGYQAKIEQILALLNQVETMRATLHEQAQ